MLAKALASCPDRTTYQATGLRNIDCRRVLERSSLLLAGGTPARAGETPALPRNTSTQAGNAALLAGYVPGGEGKSEVRNPKSEELARKALSMSEAEIFDHQARDPRFG
jgi:hypothetical protein